MLTFRSEINELDHLGGLGFVTSNNPIKEDVNLHNRRVQVQI